MYVCDRNLLPAWIRLHLPDMSHDSMFPAWRMCTNSMLRLKQGFDERFVEGKISGPLIRLEVAPIHPVHVISLFNFEIVLISGGDRDGMLN